MSSEPPGQDKQDKPVRFVAPRQRGMLMIRALVGYTGSLALCVVSAIASLKGSDVAALIGFSGASCFGVMGLLAWRRSRSPRPPLVVDERGVAVDNGLGVRWRVPWEHIESVKIAHGWWRRRVALVLREPVGSALPIPNSCHVDAPAEWVAGLIETFRQRALHGDTTP